MINGFIFTILMMVSLVCKVNASGLAEPDATPKVSVSGTVLIFQHLTSPTDVMIPDDMDVSLVNSVTIMQCTLTKDYLAPISDVIRTLNGLTGITFSNTGIKSFLGDFFDTMPDLPKLKHLGLKREGFDDRDAVRISCYVHEKYKGLEHLFLNNNNIGSEGAIAISRAAIYKPCFVGNPCQYDLSISVLCS